MRTRALLLPKMIGLACGLGVTGCSDPQSPGDTETAPTTGGTQGSGGTGMGSPGPGSDPTNPTPTNSNPADGTVDPDGTDGTDDAADSSTGDPPLECPYEPVDGMPDVTLEMVAEGFDRPVLALGHPTEPDRLFVVEQGGNVRILEPGQTTAPESSFLFVDVSNANNNSIGPESGLLGFAFHPDFPDDPRVYINYNPPAPGDTPLRTVVSEFMLDPDDPNQVDPDSERIVIELHQPAGNHNGGMIDFGPDGNLLISMGDGGGGGDPFNTGRAPNLLLAKMLRIGVEPDGSADEPTACMDCPQYGPFDYTIPADNPFVDDPAFAPEVYAWGLRNAWRFAQDPETDVIYAGDVGQQIWEEITLIEPGRDYGWSDMEAFHCFGGAPCDDTPGPNEVNADGMTLPLVEYNHNDGRCSVTGGAVYRSCEVPAWDGIYMYSDFCSGQVFGLIWNGNTVTDLGELFDQGELPLGNGWNAYGDVFITTVDAIIGGQIFDGRVYRVAPAE